MNNNYNTDFLIIGGGIVGLSIARELHRRYQSASIILIEKESDVALHASGRNSGVLHAGFYYTSDSLKARFVVDGNKRMTEYCHERNLPINHCGKVVVAKDEYELKVLYELEKRGRSNGVNVGIIDEKELNEIEPNAKTYLKALYSPNTSSVDPGIVCKTIFAELNKKIRLLLNTRYIRGRRHEVITNVGKIGYGCLVNAAGLYADKIAHDYDAGKEFTLIPFKGLYLKYNDNNLLRSHVYPVPNLKNPFLGVHYTKTVDGHVKMGPTSTPAFWRENYNFSENLRLNEVLEVMYYETMMMLRKSDFRSLAIDEVKKYSRKYLINEARYLTKNLDYSGFGSYIKPGIRAQLVNKKTLDLIMDFKVEVKENTIHVLNAISPAFTCAFSFADYVVDKVK